MPNNATIICPTCKGTGLKSDPATPGVCPTCLGLRFLTGEMTGPPTAAARAPFDWSPILTQGFRALILLIVSVAAYYGVSADTKAAKVEAVSKENGEKIAEVHRDVKAVHEEAKTTRRAIAAPKEEP